MSHHLDGGLPARLASFVQALSAIPSGLATRDLIDGREVAMRENTDDTQRDVAAEELVEETLVEEVFIDGMCGVY